MRVRTIGTRARTRAGSDPGYLLPKIGKEYASRDISKERPWQLMKHWPQFWQFSGYEITDFIDSISNLNTSRGQIS